MKVKWEKKRCQGSLPWCKFGNVFFVTIKFDEGREQEYHVAPFVHDRCSAVRTTDFAGKFMPCRLLSAVVPSQVVVAVREVDVLLVEDGCPLEGSSCGGISKIKAYDTAIHRARNTHRSLRISGRKRY